jgi:hypothetical protein
MSCTRHSSLHSARTHLPGDRWRLTLVHPPNATPERSTRCPQAGAGDPFPTALSPPATAISHARSS